MSSFNCLKCGIANIDGSHGYTTGCQHYPPEIDRYYHVKVKNSEGELKHTTLRFYNKKWVNLADELIEWKKL